MKTILSRIFQDIRQIKTALIILLVYCIFTQWRFQTVCPFAILTGFPCPACGLTRAALCVLTLQFGEACRLNAAVYLWIPYLIYLIFFRYLAGKKPPLLPACTVGVCIFTILYYLFRIVCYQLPAGLISCPGLLPNLLFPFRHC